MKHKLILITLLILMAFTAPFQALASSPTSLAMLRVKNYNGDYLNDISNPLRNKSFQEILFDKNLSKEMSERYNNFDRRYEIQKAYRLDRPEDQIQFKARNQDWMQWAVKRMVEYHVERMAKGVSQNPNVSAGVVSAINTAHNVQNPAFNISEDTKAKLKYDLYGGRFNLDVTSALVDSNVHYSVRHIDSAVGTGGLTDQLSVGMHKNLNAISASTQVQYGLVNQSIYYGASKHLVGPLSTQIGQARYHNAAYSIETIGRLSIGFSF